MCEDVLDYFSEREQSIIEHAETDLKGLAIDNIEGMRYIKYLENPLTFNPSLFGRFINSDVFELYRDSSRRKYICSAEIHVRNPSGSIIPFHQDNAYFGFERGNALTFIFHYLIRMLRMVD